jgi:DnaK suppressor protein
MAARTPFTKAELTELRKRLESERGELQAQFTDIEEGSFGTNQSEMSGEVGFDEEFADAGSATFEREKDLSITNNIRDLLEKIDKAIHRMDEGTYGVCTRCGKPIEKLRIKALPYASLCIKDKTAEEHSRGR